MGRKKKVEQEVYHVEVITKARVGDDGDWEYYVKWAGYDSDADSWEPQENVKQCERLLTSFWKHVGTDDEDYLVGYEVAAQDDWIQDEMDLFAKQFSGGRRKLEKDNKKRKGKQEKAKVPEPKKVEIRTTSSEEESDVPLKNISAVAKSSQKKKRKKEVIASGSDSDSSAGRPLKQQRKQKFSSSRSRSHTADKEPPRPKTSAEPAEKPTHNLPPPPRPSASSVPSPTLPLPPPPKIQPIRTHQDQKFNPLVKPMELPSQAAQSGSALTTKQRIAAGSGSSAATKPKPLQQAQPKLLTGFSFKKKPTETKEVSSVTERLSHQSFERKSNEKDASSTSNAQASGPSTTVLPGVGASHSSITKQTVDEPFSPVSPFVDPDAVMFEVDDITAPPPPPPVPAVREQLAKPVPPKRPSEIAADQFLGSINIPGLNSPLEPPVSDSTHEVDSFRPKALTTMKPSAMPKIPKKWKWEGDLFFDFVQNRAEQICQVTIKDPTDSRDGARMSSMMAQTDTIRIQNLYTVLDLTPVFRACGEVQQFARLSTSENQDTRALHGLFRYMSYQRQVAVFPLSLDGAELALLLMFSPSLDGLCTFLRVPDHLRQNSQNTHALVALLPWLVSSAKYNKGTTRKPVNETIQRLLIPGSQPKDSRRRILKGTVATMALDLLAFPPELLDFMNLPNRSYCVWSFPADGTAANPGFETRQLKYLLSKTSASSVSLDKDARVIFIHIGALETFYSLSALVAKRRDTPEVRFFTYGTHESFPSSRWGMHEVLPLGGIVTFTPLAMAENPFGCYALMLQLAQHPLWECYLIPSILGLSHSLSCGKEKPTLEVLRMDSSILPILDLVDAGSIAVMQSPLTGEDAWIKDFINMQGLEGHALLEECIQISIARFTHCSDSEVLVAADKEISRDLLNMELQPAFMDNYRRFVIIRAASEDSRSIPEGGSGLEWSSVLKFQFGDDFFPVTHNR